LCVRRRHGAMTATGFVVEHSANTCRLVVVITPASTSVAAQTPPSLAATRIAALEVASTDHSIATCQPTAKFRLAVTYLQFSGLLFSHRRLQMLWDRPTAYNTTQNYSYRGELIDTVSVVPAAHPSRSTRRSVQTLSQNSCHIPPILHPAPISRKLPLPVWRDVSRRPQSNISFVLVPTQSNCISIASDVFAGLTDRETGRFTLQYL